MIKKRAAAAFTIPMARSYKKPDDGDDGDGGGNGDHNGFEMYAFQAERSDGPFTCLKCKETVILRKGAKKAHHFAHRPSSTCKIKSHAVSESAQHKYAKAILSSTLPLWTISRRCANISTALNCTSEDATTFSANQKAVQELQCGHYRLDIGVQENGVTCTAIEVRCTNAVSAEKRRTLQCSGIDVLEVDATCVIAAFDTKRFMTVDVSHGGWYCPRCKPTQCAQDALISSFQRQPTIWWACVDKRHSCPKTYGAGRIVRNKPWNGMVSMYRTPDAFIFGVFVQPYEPKREKLEGLFRQNPGTDFYWASPVTIQNCAAFVPLRVRKMCSFCPVVKKRRIDDAAWTTQDEMGTSSGEESTDDED